MTEEFRTYIEHIRNKSLELHQSLVVERERSSSFSAEISRIQELLQAREQEILELRAHSEELQQLVDEQREQMHQASAEVSKDIAIDGLVKEIDFCIQQLKIANE